MIPPHSDARTVFARSALLGIAAAVTIAANPVPPVAATNSPSFAADIVPVFRSRCAACHMTGQENGKLALRPADAYASLVGVPSVGQPALKRVAAGDPANSYLLLKLEGKHLAAGGRGARMPLVGAPLDAATLATVRKWIAAGARNN